MFKKYFYYSINCVIFRNTSNKSLQDIYVKYIKLLIDIKDLNKWS